MRPHAVHELGAPAGFRPYHQPQIRPVEAVHEYGRAPAKELVENVAARRGVGGGGQRDGLHLAELGLERAQGQIVRAEIVSPL